MKQPFYLRWLSYIAEVHIESAPSDINPHLYVCLSRGRYQLATQNAVYSYGDLYTNFYRSFKLLDWDLLHGDEVLLLGMGLGSIPYMLEKSFDKDLAYTGVEIDERVAYLANKYVLSHLYSPITVVLGDAGQFVKRTTNQFDLICMDVFLDDSIPDHLCTEEFLQAVSRCLTDDGLLMYNCLARTKDDVHKTRHFLDNVFLQVFPQGGYLDVRGNWMLVSDTRFFGRS